MSMDIGLLYAIVAGVAVFVNAIIFSRTRVTDYKETVDVPFCRLLIFFMLFAAEDCIWGTLTSRVLFEYTHRNAYIVFSYGFHLFAAVSAFMWSGYTLNYAQGNANMKRFFVLARYILLILQISIIIGNIWTKKFFYIDEEAVYHTYEHRTVNFAIQMSYYVLLIIYGFNLLFQKHTDPANVRQNGAITTMIFSFIPLIFGFGQLRWPDAPMYSVGFMVSAVCIYSFTVTKQREDFMKRLMNEERDRLALLAAEEANTAKTNFLFNMSHDIRTPMNAILGFANLAKKNIDDEKVLNDCLDKVLLSGDHLLTLINDVLDMSRIEAGKVNLEPVPVNLLENNKKLIAIVEELAENKSVDFRTDFTKVTDPYVNCDVLRMNQILLNILSNAIKYTPAGGTVWYTTEQLPCEESGKHRYLFRVKDTGIGMSPEFLAKIFDEFEREDTATQSGIQGTGLGMSIVKRLADMMDVKIDIQSEKGKGTDVTCLVDLSPCDRSQIAGEEESREIDQSFLQDKRVLLVDDNELNREIATDILEDMGLVVETAVNGRDAVEKVQNADEGYYTCVFMDIQMPVMNGYEAARAIRALEGERFALLPIIAMTANAFDEDRKNAFAAGMNAHLTKPINEKAIVETLARFVKK